VIIGGTAFWIIQQPQNIPLAILTTLGTLIAFSQILPLLFPTGGRRGQSGTSPSQVTEEGQNIAQASSLSHSPPLIKVHHNLPSLRGEYVDRERYVAKVIEGLTGSWPLVSIVGMGGVGKTTLAIQIARCCLPGPKSCIDPSFEYGIWVSTKDRPELKRWFNEVVNTIADVLDYPTIAKLPSGQVEQRKREINQILITYRTLVIIDNFETINDKVLEEWIQHVPEPSKVLVTSRSHVQGAFTFELKGLGTPEALEFIQKLAHAKELQSIEVAQENVLLPLVQFTNGNPKAIELALGHIKRGLSLSDVTEHLQMASKTTEDVFNDLFYRAWKTMTSEAQNLLLITPFFVDPMKKKALGAVSGVTGDDLNIAIEELVNRMLLEVNEESIGSHSYSVHPLTRAFANAQLQNAQQFEEQARKRWSEYYLNFARDELVQERPKERYWNTLMGRDYEAVDQERANIRKLLAWTDEYKQDQLLVDLMLVLTHYMNMSFLHTDRLYYAQKAAEAAERLGRKEEAVLFYVDARGWVLIETGRLSDAEQEILKGLHIAQNLGADSVEATELTALARSFLARVRLEQSKVEDASAIIDQVLPFEYGPVIQVRVNLIAGDIAYAKKQYIEALKYYKDAFDISNRNYETGGFADWDVYHRWGIACLAIGDTEKAGELFRFVIDNSRSVSIETIRAKYGLACIAQKRGEKDEARHLAQQALDELNRADASHRFHVQIQQLLNDLTAESEGIGAK
jgi:LuxR family transcriptional regulator, glucitol operon activator